MTQNTNPNANGDGNRNGHIESPLYTVPPGHLLLHLSSEKTAAFSLPSYPAVSFYLYVPSSHPVCRRKRCEPAPTSTSTSFQLPESNGTVNGNGNGNGKCVSDGDDHAHGVSNGHARNGDGDGGGEKQYPLVVCMHGSSRDAEGVRNRWADLAEREGFVVLAPLFPVDMNTIDGMHNFKTIRFPLLGHDEWSHDETHARFDHLLLEMIDLVSQRWGHIETERFGLTGYSGGAQFAHRFFYLHPDRIHTLCVGAPGTATPLDPSLPWPFGIADTPTQFAQSINLKNLRQTSTQLLVGTEDKWRPTSNDGTTPSMNRIDTMRMLRDDWRDKGIQVEYQELEGVKHEETEVIEYVQAFMLRGLRREFS